jgi:hypothetical protein
MSFVDPDLDSIDDIPMRSKVSVLILALCLYQTSAGAEEADKMRRFLVACGYGTLIGASIGAASLAFTDDPGSKTMNIAKGASLGLYGGIFVGLYGNHGQNVEESGVVPAISPLVRNGKIEGAQFSILGLRF